MRKILCLVLAMALWCACAAPALAETWLCSACGTANEHKFCGNCGTARPEKPVCPACGFELKAGRTYKFCSECGVKFAAPITVATPTPEPTATPAPTPAPTATPTPVPVERKFLIDETSTLAGGKVRIHWQDNVARGPYKVCYEMLLHQDYDSDVQQATVRWVGEENVTGDSVTLSGLVPGVPYWITVFDADGVMVKSKYTPMARARFSDFNISATLSPRRNTGTEMVALEHYVAWDIMSDGESYGANLRLTYPDLEESRTYMAMSAITCPDGTVFVESVDDDFCLDQGSNSTYWEYYNLDSVFSALIGIYEVIPTGEYTWTLYLNAAPAASATFTVK